MEPYMCPALKRGPSVRAGLYRKDESDYEAESDTGLCPGKHRLRPYSPSVLRRLDLSSADLREAAARTDDAKASRRMLAIALILDGWSREAAAEACAMDRQTLRDWVHRYNESGLDGLSNGPRRNGTLQSRIAAARKYAQDSPTGGMLAPAGSSSR